MVASSATQAIWRLRVKYRAMFQPLSCSALTVHLHGLSVLQQVRAGRDHLVIRPRPLTTLISVPTTVPISTGRSVATRPALEAVTRNTP